jgi:hypothetical protein
MTPQNVLAELRAEAQFTEDESRAFKALYESPAFKYAVAAMSRQMLVCGDLALDTGEVKYYAGVRDGIGMFFEMTQGEAERAAVLIDSLLNAPPELLDDEDDPVASEAISAISALGMSPL